VQENDDQLLLNFFQSDDENEKENEKNDDIQFENYLDVFNLNTKKKKNVDQPQHRLSFANSIFTTLYTRGQLELSGKMQIMYEILLLSQQCNDRVILFSQSIPTLNTIQQILTSSTDLRKKDEKRNHSFNFLRIDGNTSQQDRSRIIEQFNDPEENYDLILISTKAGGEGINLCAANRIIIFDVCWNPCHDAQSMCRCYRFGQQKPVFVYRLIADGTMEKKVYDLQIRKEGIAKRIVDEKTIERKFKDEDVKNYFDLNEFQNSLKQNLTTTCIPQLLQQDDPVLTQILSTKKHLLTQVFEQETMFEEDLDQNCTEKEQQEAMESYQYTKAIYQLQQQNKIPRFIYLCPQVIRIKCTHCFVLMDLYPKEISKIPIPKTIECTNCKEFVCTTQNHTSITRITTPNTSTVGPFGASSGGATASAAAAYAMYAAATRAAVAAAAATAPPAPPLPTTTTRRPIPSYMERFLPPRTEQLVQPTTSSTNSISTSNTTSDKASLVVNEEEKRRLNDALQFKERCILVLRKGIQGSHSLKRQAEVLGATLAIEVNAQLTDIVSNMSLQATLQWLKLSKLPRDVCLHDAKWLEKQILNTQKKQQQQIEEEEEEEEELMDLDLLFTDIPTTPPPTNPTNPTTSPTTNPTTSPTTSPTTNPTTGMNTIDDNSVRMIRGCNVEEAIEVSDEE
jgi:hypothetical protein